LELTAPLRDKDYYSSSMMNSDHIKKILKKFEKFEKIKKIKKYNKKIFKKYLKYQIILK